MREVYWPLVGTRGAPFRVHCFRNLTLETWLFEPHFATLSAEVLGLRF